MSDTRQTKLTQAPSRTVPLASIRLREIERLITDMYGPVLPDDDAGREIAMLALNTIAYKKAKDPEWLMRDWIARRAPCINGEELDARICSVLGQPMRYRADTLAQELGLLYVDRQRLAITTIGAIDVPKEQRDELRRERDKIRKRMKRRKAGAVPREQFEAESVRAKAAAEGINPSTWYRRQKGANSHYAADGRVALPVARDGRARLEARPGRHAGNGLTSWADDPSDCAYRLALASQSNGIMLGEMATPVSSAARAMPFAPAIASAYACGSLAALSSV